MKDLKYLISYSIPLAVVIGLIMREYWVFFTPVFAFVIVPFFEILLPKQEGNLSDKEIEIKSKNPLFDLFLYINLPIVYCILGWFFSGFSSAQYSSMEIVGLTLSLGILVGSNGVNVAHELGHRQTRWEKTLGKILLLPALYMHFYIEHNFGHHMNAATPEDPASAKYNQSVYSFWATSIIRQYISAWKIQNAILKRKSKSFFSTMNDMMWYVIFQSLYLFSMAYFLGIQTAMIALAIGVIGAVLLETINYIEHYGLSRKKKASGRYERVAEIHSWNSNHILGRVMLYELTRHSDHHYRAHKKYQLLNCHETSPQMPFGYPTSMVLSLVPPLWFLVMNKRIPLEMRP